MNALDLVYEYLIENGVPARVLVREKKTGFAHRIIIDTVKRNGLYITSTEAVVEIRERKGEKRGEDFFWEHVWKFDLHDPESLQNILKKVKGLSGTEPDQTLYCGFIVDPHQRKPSI